MTHRETVNANGKPQVLDPLPMDQIASLSGMEIFEHMKAGNLPVPPMMVHSNILLKDFEKGRVNFIGLPERQFLNPMGTVHGGWISTILDTALSCAVHTCLEPGETYTTTSLNVTMVRPLMAGSGEVTCEGRTVHKGRKLASSEGELKDARGKLIAHATVTCMVMPRA